MISKEWEKVISDVVGEMKQYSSPTNDQEVMGAILDVVPTELIGEMVVGMISNDLMKNKKGSILQEEVRNYMKDIFDEIVSRVEGLEVVVSRA